MASDFFGGLKDSLDGLAGGLAKSGIVPKDTPEGKILIAQSELSDFQKQEEVLLIEIGRQAYEQNPSAWQQNSKMSFLRENIASAQATLDEAKREMEQAEAEKAAEESKSLCANCGFKNNEGVNFCQECGSPVTQAEPKRFCTSCGMEVAAGMRFCVGCGAKQGE